MTTKTQTALRKLIADASTAPKMRRAATLRLGRLRAASRPAITTRTKPAPAPSEDAKFEAYQSFVALSAQRSALHRKRRSTGEQGIFGAMVALMPANSPTTDDPQQWRDFIAQVEGVLAEIKSAKTL